MNAIIAAATGYAEVDIRPFLRSVERYCTDTTVFLIAYKDDHEKIDQIKRSYAFVKIVRVRKKVNRFRKIARILRGLAPLYRHLLSCVNRTDYQSANAVSRSLGRYPLHIACERYFIALDLVRKYGDTFSNILLTDSRDVILQSDPFRLIGAKLVTGIEAQSIGKCPINSAWIEVVYGQDVLKQLSDRHIICSGVTFGTHKAITNYLNEMCREMWKHLLSISFESGFDQGVHNFLLHTGKIAADLTDNRKGFIATLGYEQSDNIIMDTASGLVRLHSNHPAIVHQHDRYPDLVEFVNKNPALQ